MHQQPQHCTAGKHVSSLDQTLGYQPKVTQLDLKDTQILQNPPIIARYFGFKDTKYNQTQLVLYWYETATFIANNTAQQKNVEISLISYPETPLNMTEEENTLLPFAVAIANHWQPIKTWTQIALLISRNGSILATVTATLLACIVIPYFIGNMKTKKANANAYQKLSKENQRIIDAIYQTQKSTTPTLNAVATKYYSITRKCTSKEKILQKLLEAEKIGLIKCVIANEKDEPMQVWKAQIPLDKT